MAVTVKMKLLLMSIGTVTVDRLRNTPCNSQKGCFTFLKVHVSMESYFQ